MKRKFVIDTSVYITYAMYNKLDRLFELIANRELKVFIDDNLLSELERNFHKKLKTDLESIKLLLNQIKVFTIFHKTVLKINSCPDPKDNFLFDLAIQTDSEVIVTQEKALLSWKESPVLVHDLKWFKENFAL